MPTRRLAWFALLLGACDFPPAPDGGVSDLATPVDTRITLPPDLEPPPADLLPPRDLIVPCADGVQDGDETDVDCGGKSCPACATGRHCMAPADCQDRGACTLSVCQVPTCNDGVHNGAETDVDCGGWKCPLCAVGLHCKTDYDCIDYCHKTTCEKVTCAPKFRTGANVMLDVVDYRVADFDRDGALDLAVIANSRAVSFVRGKGDGTFASPSKTLITAGVVALADWDGDHIPDLLNDTELWRGKGDGTFVLFGQFNGSPGNRLLPGDFDGDGKSDILAFHKEDTSPHSNYLRRFTHLGSGVFDKGVDVAGDGGLNNVVIIDVKIEHARGHGPDAFVYVEGGLGNHNIASSRWGFFDQKTWNFGFFGEPNFADPFFPGDFDGDGIDETLATAIDTSPGYDKGIDSDGILIPGPQFLDKYWPVAIGDFNGDGKLDYFGRDNVSRAPGGMRCGNGDLTFQRGVDFKPPGAAVGDLNGDGKSDLISLGNGGFTVFLNDN